MAKFTRFVRLALALGALPSGASYAQHTLALATSQDVRPTTAETNDTAQQQSLESLLQELKTTYKVSFFYRSQLTQGKTVDRHRAAFKSLAEALRYVAQQSGLQFEPLKKGVYVITTGKTISRADSLRPAISPLTSQSIPTPMESPELAATQPAKARGLFAAADVTVTGRVTQKNGEGLPGVTVIVKGGAQGTTTDAEGNFSIRTTVGSTLTFSSVGFTAKDIVVTGANTSLSVVLTDSPQGLNEVVVVGYGTQRREDVTGSIASVTAKEIAATPVTGLDQAMQGRAAGVQVSQNNGAPGGGVSIRIRGVGTVTGNAEPLYVVDGIPFYSDPDGSNGNLLNTINPADIASIDILKDASATAIYGSRGANGVVIITTKRGKAGRTNVTLDTYGGIQTIGHKVQLLNASQFAQLSNELLVNGGQQPNNATIVGAANATSPDYSNPDALGTGTDWLKEIFRTAGQQSYNLTASGGNEKTQFALSGGYFKQDGIIIGSDFKRYSARFNIDHQLSNRIKIGNSLTLSRTTQRIVTTDEDTQSGLVFLAINQLPTLPVYRNGTYAGPEGRIAFVGDRSNPVGRANTLDNHLYRNRLLGNVYGEVELLPGLRFRTNVGLDANFRDASFFEPSYQWGSIVHATASASQSSYQELIWLWENTFTYNKTFADKHALTVLAGTSAQSSSAKFLGGNDNTYPFNSIQALGQGTTATSSSALYNSSLASYMGRVNYAFADRYLFTGTVRVDGSSRFGPSNKYGVFPSGSVAWRVSQENFIKNALPQVSDLKLRFSYGLTGNQNGIGLYDYATLLNSTQRYTFGNAILPGVVPTSLPNPDLQWEVSKQADLGLDLALFDNRIVFTGDLFSKRTEKLLLYLPVVPSSGYLGTAAQNAGNLRNVGLELGLNTRNLVGAFTWGSNFNITFINNKVLDLSTATAVRSGSILTQYTSLTAPGHAVGSFYGYVTDGIFQTADEVKAHATQQPGTAAGDIRFKDLNGDGVINDQDRTFIGNPTPKFTAGFTNNFAYKNFDLSVFLYGVYGNKLFNANRVFDEAMSGAANQTTRVLGRWKSAADPGDGSTPRAVFGDPNTNSRISDRYIEDGSFLRLKNVTLGYTFQAKDGGVGFGKVRAQSLRLYATAQNLLTFTHYTGFDPEVGSFGQSATVTGVDNGTYPVARTFTVGLNLGL
ncbi:MAG: SusC/RagA family TonB-linked outer membrane protein [Janthinobacterium lividum]